MQKIDSTISGSGSKVKIKKANQKAKDSSLAGNEKIKALLDFDKKLAATHLKTKGALLLGTDEVGRGCLAGPVVAAAVVLPELESDSELAGLLARLNDSKKLSPGTREELAEIIKEHCIYAIAEASVEEIETLNILQASFLAMKRAIEKLSLPESSLLLVDGNQKVRGVELKQILVIGGDAISASIAAASVIAKVYRDKLMSKLASEFEHYKWDSNKGYGSKDHLEAIAEHGLSPWHRKKFCSKLKQRQLSIF